MVKTLNFHCRGHGFNPWSGNSDLTNNVVWPKKQVLSDQGVRGKGWCRGWRQIGPSSRGRRGGQRSLAKRAEQQTHQKAVATWRLVHGSGTSLASTARGVTTRAGGTATAEVLRPPRAKASAAKMQLTKQLKWNHSLQRYIYSGAFHLSQGREKRDESDPSTTRG